jgi:hypothetical protein
MRRTSPVDSRKALDHKRVWAGGSAQVRNPYVSSVDGVPAPTLTTDQMFIPADRDDDWVWFRPISQPYGSFGPESQVASE